MPYKLSISVLKKKIPHVKGLIQRKLGKLLCDPSRPARSTQARWSRSWRRLGVCKGERWGAGVEQVPGISGSKSWMDSCIFMSAPLVSMLDWFLSPSHRRQKTQYTSVEWVRDSGLVIKRRLDGGPGCQAVCTHDTESIEESRIPAGHWNCMDLT